MRPTYLGGARVASPGHKARKDLACLVVRGRLRARGAVEASSDPKQRNETPTQTRPPKGQVQVAERLLSFFEWIGWLARVVFAGAGIALVLGVVSRPVGVRVVLGAIAVLLCTQVLTRILKRMVMAVVQRGARVPRGEG